METTATLEMAIVPLLRDAIFENLGDSPQCFEHFLTHTLLSICEMPLSITGSRLGFAHTQILVRLIWEEQSLLRL